MQDEIVKLISTWQTNPYRYAVEALGVKPTSQQREALMLLGEYVTAKIKKFNSQPMTEREDMLRTHIGVSIMSGKGTGKDAFMAWCILWFLSCFRNSKIPLTGPSRNQMKDVLMAEIAKWANRLDDNGDPCFVFRDDVVIQSEKIYMKDPESPNAEGKSWFARIRTVPKNAKEEAQSKNMDGLHEDFMMIGVDEADGVGKAVMTSLETTVTGPVNFILAIFNPSKNFGYAYETHYGARSKYWLKLHWDSRFSENVSPEQVAQVLDTYGEGSHEYRVNVLGLPPEQNDDSLIPLEWIHQAIEREITPDPESLRVMGVDPSRQGGDPAGVIIRDGHKIIEYHEFKKLDTRELADEVASIFLEAECDLMFIDTIGNGAGVYDQLKHRLPGKVRSVDVSTKPKDQRRKFHRLRDELWWKVRTNFEQGLIDLPPDHPLTVKLKNELLVMKRDSSDDSIGKIKIESKAKMKNRGVKSPNLADAYMVTMACQDNAFQSGVVQKKKAKDPYDDYVELDAHDRLDWMRI